MIFLRFIFSLILVVVIKSTFPVLGQTEVDERAMISFDRGLGFHAPDTSFGLNLRFRIQNRLGLTAINNQIPEIDEVEARIRRLRLRIDGYTKIQSITYYLQLSFSRSDLDWENSGVPNIIRDAMVYYTFNDNFYVGFGQGKLPGNRQRINSSGQLQFVDRSNVNARFNIDRDFGIMTYYSGNTGNFHYNIKNAISTGEGRNALASDNGLAYTGRIELLPLGKFIGDGDFSEGDLKREPFPKLALAGGYHFNQKAIRTQGQRGKPLFEPRNLKTTFFDFLFKYNGWSAYAEYMDRYTSDPLTISPDDKLAHVRTGYGINMQLSYLFPNYYELAGRYTFVNPEKILSHTGLPSGENGASSLLSQPPFEEYTFGITRYIMKHKVKAQGNIIYRKTENIPGFTVPENKWMLQLQIELGI